MIALALLAACGGKAADSGSDPCAGSCTYELDLEGSSYGAWDGGVVTAALVDMTDGGAVLEELDQAVVLGDIFFFAWPDAIRDGSTYDLAWFIDANADCGCDPEPDDVGWSTVVGPEHGPRVVRSQGGDATDAEICANFYNVNACLSR